MFWRMGEEPHGLKHNPWKACVAPRPIAWITSRSPDGIVNLAPFSYYNAFGDNPPVVAIGFSGRKPAGSVKDSRRNIEATGAFVVHMPTRPLRDIMNASAAPFDDEESEVSALGLETTASDIVDVPRLLAAPVAIECRYLQTITLPGQDQVMVLGQGVGLHIDDAILRDGMVDLTLAKPLARLGYMQYAAVEELFDMPRPTRPDRG